MYLITRILVLGVLCFLGGPLVKSEDDSWSTFNNGNDIVWNFPDNSHNTETIDIDDKPTGSIYYGSGDGWDKQYDDTETDEFSGDDNEGSGYQPEESCLRLQQQMESKRIEGMYVPKCTAKGEFEKKQCHDSVGSCWCVDKTGREVPETRKKSPDSPDCDNPEIQPPTRRKGVETRPKSDDVIVLPTADAQPEFPNKNDEMDNSINAMPDGGEVDIQTLAPSSNEVEGMMSSKGEYVNSSAVMKQPGILAGIIGGAVIGLLCAVLLVMFIVYRMRKKDEGSYALDEKRSPSHHTYQRANTREFYA